MLIRGTGSWFVGNYFSDVFLTACPFSVMWLMAPKGCQYLNRRSEGPAALCHAPLLPRWLQDVPETLQRAGAWGGSFGVGSLSPCASQTPTFLPRAFSLKWWLKGLSSKPQNNSFTHTQTHVVLVLRGNCLPARRRSPTGRWERADGCQAGAWAIASVHQPPLRTEGFKTGRVLAVLQREK